MGCLKNGWRGVIRRIIGCIGVWGVDVSGKFVGMCVSWVCG